MFKDFSQNEENNISNKLNPFIAMKKFFLFIFTFVTILLFSSCNKRECSCHVRAYDDYDYNGVTYGDVFYEDRYEVVETNKECYEVTVGDFSSGTQQLMQESSSYVYDCQEYW